MRANVFKLAQSSLFIRNVQRRHTNSSDYNVSLNRPTIRRFCHRVPPTPAFPLLPARTQISPHGDALAPRSLPKYITHARAAGTHAASHPASAAPQPLSPTPECPASYQKSESTLDARASSHLQAL